MVNAMNVVDKRIGMNKIRFDELKTGDVFDYGGVLYIRLQDVSSGAYKVYCNAVTAADFALKKFNNDDLVTRHGHELFVYD